mgnify:CR=1 FL=1
MKPTKCWSCKYVAKCNNTVRGGCSVYDRWGLSLQQVAVLSNTDYKTLKAMFRKNEVTTLKLIEELSGQKFKVVKEDGKRIFVEV